MGEVSLGMPALHRARHPETWRSVCPVLATRGGPASLPCASHVADQEPAGSPVRSLGAFTSCTPNCEGLRQAVARAVCQRGLGERPGRAQVACLRHRPPPPRACPLLLWRGSHLVEHLGADAWGVKGPTHRDFKNGPNAGLPRAPHCISSSCSTVVGGGPRPGCASALPGEDSTLTAKLKSIKGYTNIKHWRKGVPGSFSGNANPQTLPQPAESEWQ